MDFTMISDRGAPGGDDCALAIKGFFWGYLMVFGTADGAVSRMRAGRLPSLGEFGIRPGNPLPRRHAHREKAGSCTKEWNYD